MYSESIGPSQKYVFVSTLQLKIENAEIFNQMKLVHFTASLTVNTGDHNHPLIKTLFCD